MDAIVADEAAGRGCVDRLERAADEEEAPPDPRDLPAGDRIASEFHRFLKQRGER
jgi:hypothetical protein